MPGDGYVSFSDTPILHTRLLAYVNSGHRVRRDGRGAQPTIVPPSHLRSHRCGPLHVSVIDYHVKDFMPDDLDGSSGHSNYALL
jgi:hypothetical protein